MTTWTEVQIPDTTDGLTVEAQINLGEADYQLRLEWAENIGRWLLSLADQGGAPIFAGRPVVGYRLYESRPVTGQTWTLAVVPNGPDQSPPGLGELGPGKRCSLMVGVP